MPEAQTGACMRASLTSCSSALGVEDPIDSEWEMVS